LSDNKEDLELEALQRELDDAFATTRPRRGFEDDLWMRMQARRPLWTRLRDAFGSLGPLFREAPAIPLGAVAVLLVVVVGASILVNSGLRPGTTHNSYSQGAAEAPNLASGEFGKLPTPALHPGLVPSSYAPNAPNGLASDQSNLYFGPATLRWTGQMPLGSVVAPVMRYAEPSVSDADQFAASLGASGPTKSGPEGALALLYTGQDFTVLVSGTVVQLPREPFFALMPTTSNGPYASDPQVAAEAFLNRFSLAPAWPNSVTVQQSGGVTRVQYLRAFPIASGALAYLVGSHGERYGIEVDWQNGHVLGAAGPWPLNLDSAMYPLITNDQAVRMALASTPSTSQAIQPQPTVNLTSVELVYALAFARGQGYYEPAYLFSGTFQYNGQTYTKRVLVPLVDPTLRS
jgi:hypothetical protein